MYFVLPWDNSYHVTNCLKTTINCMTIKRYMQKYMEYITNLDYLKKKRFQDGARNKKHFILPLLLRVTTVI